MNSDEEPKDLAEGEAVDQSAEKEQAPEQKETQETPEEQRKRQGVAAVKEQLIKFVREELNCKDLASALEKELRGDIEPGVVVNERSPRNWLETKFLAESFRKGLTETFRAFDAVAAKNPTGEYKLLSNKKEQMVRSLLMLTFEGHMTAKDVGTLVQSIHVVSPNNLASLGELGTRIQNGINASGYEGAFIYDHQTKSVIIFEDTLSDQYKGTGKLDFRHMLTHEVSHGVLTIFTAS